MNAKPILRFVAPALALATGLLACASSGTTTNEPLGVANPQAPSQQCSHLRHACIQHSDCCSQWCANGECARKEP
jgi:hypothetical protein